MGKEICAKEFLEYFDTFEKKVNSMKELVEQARKGLAFVAEKLELGRVEFYLQAPISRYEPDGIQKEMVLYNRKSGYEDAPQIYEFMTEEGGVTSVKLYPCVGVVWGEEEQTEAEFLAHTLFVLMGRARLLAMSKVADEKDAITGAFNLESLSSYIQMLIQEDTFGDYCGIYFNIKSFKYIVQEVGNVKGNEILTKYVGYLIKKLGKKGVVARVGGDNFLILVQEEKCEEILTVLRRIKVTLGNEEDKQQFNISVHAGVYRIKSEDTLKRVMDCTMIAYGLARKSDQKDVIFFEEDMFQKDMEKKRLYMMFPQAMKNKEFVVYYQPKVGVQKQNVCGGEALVRWQRESRIIMPGDFIPALEQENYICQLDYYVFNQVCKDIHGWIKKGITPQRISVNFSKKHLYEEAFAEKILKIMDRYKVNSKYIEIELTEMSNVGDFKKMIDFIEVMKGNEIKISVDDFGTGYSALNMLKDLDIDVVKFDKSFVDDLEKGNEKDKIVLENMVRMVNALGMESLAEGVETIRQVSFLQSIGCDVIQGYMYDRPIPKDEFEMRLEMADIFYAPSL